MFDHVGLDVRDYRASRAFYEQTLPSIGWGVVMEWPDHGVVGFGVEGRPMFWLHEREPYGTGTLDPDGNNVEAVCHRAE